MEITINVWPSVGGVDSAEITKLLQVAVDELLRGKRLEREHAMACLALGPHNDEDEPEWMCDRNEESYQCVVLADRKLGEISDKLHGQDDEPPVFLNDVNGTRVLRYHDGEVGYPVHPAGTTVRVQQAIHLMDFPRDRDTGVPPEIVRGLELGETVVLGEYVTGYAEGYWVTDSTGERIGFVPDWEFSGDWAFQDWYEVV